jgi:hypothetical protein
MSLCAKFILFLVITKHSIRSIDDAKAFWQREYPDMQSVPTRLAQISALGYQSAVGF